MTGKNEKNSAAKKSHIIRRREQIKPALGFRIDNTILKTLLIYMSLIMLAAVLINYIISNQLTNKIKVELPSEIFSTMHCMQNIIDTPEQFNFLYDDSNLIKYINDINKEIKGAPQNRLVKNIIIIDSEKLDSKSEEIGFDARENKDIILASTFPNKEEQNKYINPTGNTINSAGNIIKVHDSTEQIIKLNSRRLIDKGKQKGKSKYNIYMILDRSYLQTTNTAVKNNTEKEFKDLFSLDSVESINNIMPVILFLLLFIVIYLIAKSISKPLLDMEKVVSKIAEGDLSGRLGYTKYDEINQLAQSYNTMADSFQRMYSSLEKQVQDRTKELKGAYAELQSTQAMMVHSEKMKSLGELVAGIMHEINNPINFIYGNMTHLHNYSDDLMQIIDEYTKYNSSLKPEELADIEKLKQEIDYDFIKSDLPDLIKSCKEGADRAKNIIQDLKSFSRMEESAIADVDLGREIDTVLNILHNKIKHKAEVHKEYDENAIPSVEAFGGQLNQVFMNILDNAVGAIKEHGDIWIRMKKDDENKKVVIEIEDNGVGMNAETMDKVFNPFFTTKPVGQGTGLGMSITYKIIKNHQGDIRCESKEGVGSKFIVTLPIQLDRSNMKTEEDSGVVNGQV